MAKPADPQMLTANRLVDGDVLYWKSGQWVLSLKDADVFAAAKDADAALAAAQKSVADNVVVNPYLFDVKTDARGIHPVKEREIIRAAGPTVRHDLGKQAELDPPLEGGSKFAQLSEANFGEGSHARAQPLPEALRASTLPQGEGEIITKDDNVSI